jgi:hypothetical protein
LNDVRYINKDSIKTGAMVAVACVALVTIWCSGPAESILTRHELKSKKKCRILNSITHLALSRVVSGTK